MGFAYVRIFKAAGQHNRRISRSFTDSEMASSLSNQTQIAITVFIMLIVFICCWTPYFVYVIYITANHRQDVISRDLVLAAYWCVFMNSSLNPYIYGVRNPAIRAEFKRVMSLLLTTLSDWFGLVSTSGSVTSVSVVQDRSMVNESHKNVAKATSLIRTNSHQRNSCHSNESCKSDGSINEEGVAKEPSLLSKNEFCYYGHSYKNGSYIQTTHVAKASSLLRTNAPQVDSCHSNSICSVDVARASSLRVNGAHRNCCYSNDSYNNDDDSDKKKETKSCTDVIYDSDTNRNSLCTDTCLGTNAERQLQESRQFAS